MAVPLGIKTPFRWSSSQHSLAKTGTGEYSLIASFRHCSKKVNSLNAEKGGNEEEEEEEEDGFPRTLSTSSTA
jgi:hypothetical protein